MVVTLQRETHELRLQIIQISVIRTKTLKNTEWCVYRIKLMSSVLPAYMTSVWPANTNYNQRIASIIMANIWPT